MSSANTPTKICELVWVWLCGSCEERNFTKANEASGPPLKPVRCDRCGKAWQLKEKK
jgi:hypothetical protein